MIKLLFFPILLLLGNFVLAQNNSIPDTTGDLRYSNRNLYQIVEVMPNYEGGFSSLMKFIKDNVKYPEDAKAMNIQGKVNLSFIINQFGGIDSIEINPYYHVWPSIDQEAIRIIALTNGKWSVGKQNGKFVRVKTSAPIEFFIPDQELGLIKNSNSSNEQEKEASLAYENAEYKKALQLFSSIVEKDSSNYFALHNLGLCKYQTGDKEGACTDWTSLLDKGSYTAYYLYLKHCRPARVKAFTKGRFISQ